MPTYNAAVHSIRVGLAMVEQHTACKDLSEQAGAHTKHVNAVRKWWPAEGPLQVSQSKFQPAPGQPA